MYIDKLKNSDKIFEKKAMYEFEGEKFYSFENYDKALSDVYGDYMWIPPEEKRERHIIVELELSKYAQMEE